MKDCIDETIRGYIADLCARKPVPGGGSASALTASLGAALNLMVINYSFNAENTVETVKELEKEKSRQETTLNRLMSLVTEDCRAFAALMNAISEKEDIQAGYIATAKPPIETCELCAKSMNVTLSLRALANPKLLTDIGCAAHFIKSGFDSARLNANINFAHLEDRNFADNARQDLKTLSCEIEDAYSKILLFANEPKTDGV